MILQVLAPRGEKTRCKFNEFDGGEIYAPLRKLAHGFWREPFLAGWGGAPHNAGREWADRSLNHNYLVSHPWIVSMPLPVRILVGPEALARKPVIRGTRVAVEFIPEAMAAGRFDTEIPDQSPPASRVTLFSPVSRCRLIPAKRMKPSAGFRNDSSAVPPAMKSSKIWRPRSLTAEDTTSKIKIVCEYRKV